MRRPSCRIHIFRNGSRSGVCQRESSRARYYSLSQSHRQRASARHYEQWKLGDTSGASRHRFCAGRSPEEEIPAPDRRRRCSSQRACDRSGIALPPSLSSRFHFCPDRPGHGTVRNFRKAGRSGSRGRAGAKPENPDRGFERHESLRERRQSPGPKTTRRSRGCWRSMPKGYST